MIILHNWGYYGNSFLFSPQSLKVYSLRASRAVDVTSKHPEFISKAVAEERALLESYRTRFGVPDILHAKNLTILLMQVHSGVEAKSVWSEYEAVRQGIGEGIRWRRPRIEKDIRKYNQAFKPRTE